MLAICQRYVILVNLKPMFLLLFSHFFVLLFVLKVRQLIRAPLKSTETGRPVSQKICVYKQQQKQKSANHWMHVLNVGFRFVAC